MGKVPLSGETRRRLDALFHESQRQDAAELLIEECGSNLPFLQKHDPHQLERVRFAALKLSDGDMAALRRAVALAKTDWRDLLMAAGFGRDVHAHESWFPDSRRPWTSD